jgi:ATP-dependent DNA helicase RecG
MTTTVQQIDLWRAATSEHQRLEFKEAKNQFDTRKLQKYCVALANEGGGQLLLGIEDKPPRKIVGSAAFPDLVDTSAKLFQWLGFRVDIEAVQHPDGRVVVFHIPSRPRGTVYDCEGAYLMRAGEELVPMSEDRLRAIFAEGQPEWLLQPAMKGCDDNAVVQLLDTQSYFDLLHLPYPVNRAGVLERFEREKLIQRDESGWTITNLGGILFAKKLEQFDRLARKAARVVVYEGNNKLRTARPSGRQRLRGGIPRARGIYQRAGAVERSDRAGATPRDEDVPGDCRARVGGECADSPRLH